MFQDQSIRVVIWDASTVIQEQNHGFTHDLGNFIRALRPVYATVLFSHTWEELRQTLVERWDVLDAFDQAILASAGDGNPDASVFSQALSGLSVRPSEAVIVDTRFDHLEVAQDAGLHTVHFQSPAQAGTELFSLLSGSVREPWVEACGG